MSRTSRSVVNLGLNLGLVLGVGLGCNGGRGDDSDGADGADNMDATDAGTSGDPDASGDGDGDGDGGPEAASLSHRFGARSLAPFEETLPCVQWTPNNEAAMYVQAVTLSNLGYVHHSNWFVVPEELYPGEDGEFECSTRGFDELAASAAGAVLFAQSTQAFSERQQTAAGAVIKIPPRHKVVADLHLLNVGPDTVETELFLTLDLIHPRKVDAVLSALRASYVDLDIPAQAKSRFTGLCHELGLSYAQVTGDVLDIKLHYLLPHSHYLGDSFGFELDGGPLANEELLGSFGFDGQAKGVVFDPPVSWAGASGFRFSCGYDNWRDVNVGWGLGDQEMCVMLALVESSVMIDASVTGATEAVGEQDGVIEFQGPCAMLFLTKNPAQTPPTPSERSGPLIVPDSDEDIPAVPVCVDHDPSVPPALEPTLDNVFAAVFQPSCTFNACHGSSTAAGGLDLQAPDLLAELLDHEVEGDPGVALVEPGDPASSWLYRVLAECAPATGAGGTATHMPLNAPILLADPSVALVREWIAAGAMP